MLLLLEAAEKILLGTISTRGCKGPLFFCTESAALFLSAAFSIYSLLKVS